MVGSSVTRSFILTWDYLCPFARNANEHVLEALAAGAPWEVRFSPFSLHQAHVEEGGVAVWDDPSRAQDLLALEAGIVVRERAPDLFPAVHRALFEARHDKAGDLKSREVVAAALRSGGLEDPSWVFAEIEEGWPAKVLASEHTQLVSDYDVFGVPTFICEGEAAFVRLMHRPEGNPELARRTVEAILDQLVEHPELNEFKRTRIPR